MEPTSLNVVSGQKPREIAARVLQRHSAGEGFVETLLEQAFAPASPSSSFSSSSSKSISEKSRTRTRDEDEDDMAMSAQDRGLCQELVYGVIRWQAALDFLIARKTDGRPQKEMLQNLLRLGLYQIFWLDRIPNHAAVHETVEQAKQAGFGPKAGFVNAILRGYLREFDLTKNLLTELKTSQPHRGYSHPEWLVARWTKRWGTEKTARLLEWNNTPPKTFARVNTLAFDRDALTRVQSKKTDADVAAPSPPSDGGEGRGEVVRLSPKLPSPQSSPHSFLMERGRPKADLITSGDRNARDIGDLLTQWRDEDVNYDFMRRDWFEENLVFELKSHPSLAALPSFQKGFFYIQDPSTLLAVHELDPQPGETILDLCAAPGGKTTYIAQRMQNRGTVIAHDIAPDRLKLIEENCQRLGVTNVEGVSDLPSAIANRRFDRILIDAPCSNTGVMRRRVDLRWRIRAEEIARLRATQLELLRNATPFLKPGGTLVYSTCSLEPEENQEVVEAFLREQKGFKLDRERELLPFADEVDGAFVARLVRL